MYAWIQRVWAVALAVPLGAHAWIGWFSRYEGDDYCTASVVGMQGFLAAQSYWYDQWSGRFTFTALVSALELVGTDTARILPCLAVVAWVAAGTWAVLPLARLQSWPKPRLTSLVLGELIAFATLTAAPNVGQSFYWQTGLLTYTLPLIVAMAFAGWLARQVVVEQPRLSPATMTISGTAALLVGGLSETSLIIQAVALVVGLAAALLLLHGDRRRVALGLLASALFGSMLAGVVMLLAPGTRVRATVEQDPEVDLERATVAVRASLSLAVWALRRFEVLSRATFVFLIVACGALGFSVGLRKTPRRDRQSWRWTGAAIVLAVVLGYVFDALSLFPVYLVQGFDPPARVQIVTDFLLVTALAVSAFWSGSLLRRVMYERAILRSPGWVGLGEKVIIAGLILVAVAPLSEALNTFGQAPVEAAYAAEWDATDSLLRDAELGHAQVAVVPPLPPRWGWAFVATQPDAFPNGCVARYYGLPAVVASAPPPVWLGATEKGERPPGA